MAKDAVQDMLDGGAGVGAELAAFCRDSAVQAKWSRRGVADRTFSTGQGVTWRDASNQPSFGLIAEQVDGERPQWAVQQLLPTGRRDEVLVEYRDTIRGVLIFDAHELHSCDMIKKEWPDGRKTWSRNTMFHDDDVIHPSQDHDAVMAYLDAYLESIA
jgi:hypothetical protein